MNVEVYALCTMTETTKQVVDAYHSLLDADIARDHGLLRWLSNALGYPVINGDPIPLVDEHRTLLCPASKAPAYSLMISPAIADARDIVINTGALPRWCYALHIVQPDAEEPKAYTVPMPKGSIGVVGKRVQDDSQ